MAEVAEKKIGAKQPLLRFPDFNGSLRFDNLGKYIEVISGFPFKGEDISEINNGTPLLRGINITEGFIRHNADIDRYYNRSIDGLEKYLLETGDVVLGMDGSKVGRNVSIIQKRDAGSLLVQRIARIRPKSKCDINFVFQQIYSPKFHRYVDKVNTSSGIPHISLKQIKEFEIAFPSLDEQQKIASYLSAVDKRIDLLEQKKAKLEDYKRGVMQKIFKRKIRFKPQFEDLDLPPGTVADLAADFPNWEKKKLSELFEIKKGQQLNRIELKDEGDFPSISGGVEPSGYTDQWNTTENMIIISEGGNSCGYVNFIRTKFWCGGHCYSLKLQDESNNREFLYQALKFKQREIMRLRVGSGLPNIQKKDLSKFRIEIPCIEEQVKIAAFLTSIDEKISLVEKQIEGSNQFKEGLLQQMFV